jgi:F-type H+-transporting ATPase subunit delta
LRAEVTTAFSLDSARAQAIEHRLAEVTGRTVRLTTAVDPALIGGVVARLGGTIYDGSVRTQLLKLKSKLAEGS